MSYPDLNLSYAKPLAVGNLGTRLADCKRKSVFLSFFFFQIISFTAIGQCPGRGGNSSRANRIAGVKILRESRYTGSRVEQRFISELLGSSKFQDVSSFFKITKWPYLY